MKSESDKEMQIRLLRKSGHSDYVAALKEGRKQRASTFATPKDYKRKDKYPRDYRNESESNE